MFVIKEYRKGKKIVRQGTHGTSAFLIKKGKVEVYREDDEGNKKVLAQLKENDLFGEMAMISSDRRSASVIAIEDCEVAVLTREKFLALPESSPAVVRLQTIMKERLKDKK
ncbi:MAG: cyclic nucleotide-binding domain-containing protein [Nitrospinaceae bacterium]|nr:cyclic nucleotide-binding domain-containing protein [Nitrospina sp.]MBT5375837.1 cyclic nucleotide-binding domain-containing protein [Nitrospinaceae bacterium]MBT5867680.1 cyclic nucleotide-binding domain-containing protein [Nitrospinaceae bacterium]MBT6345682.1 cyclic nucleotide-binding domain-containing protein [Nitrospina sp.]